MIGQPIEASCNLGKPMPEKICRLDILVIREEDVEDYMVPYNQKLLSKALDSLGTYWLEIDKPQIMKKFLGWAEEDGVYGLGRWGEHSHHNSDMAVVLAMKMAERLLV